MATSEGFTSKVISLYWPSCAIHVHQGCS